MFPFSSIYYKSLILLLLFRKFFVCIQSDNLYNQQINYILLILYTKQNIQSIKSFISQAQRTTFSLLNRQYSMSKPPINRIAEALNAYKYSQGKPFFQYDNMSAYQAQSKDNGTKHTIKIVKKVDNDLVEYIKKLKTNHSDYTIKIHEIIHDQQRSELMIVQQSTNYGTLKTALKKCKRLDDDDCITIAKILLNGHIQLIRLGIYWFGDENDIEFTENGIKLSWNNTLVFSLNNQNPFPAILERIGIRKQTNSILPFPNNKMLNDLIKVSRENASEMSLHPLLKKKERILKKKGKNWLGLKEFKVKGQYVQQLSYLAVTKQFGFVKVKIFQNGTVNPELLKAYQTNPSYVKTLDYYQQGNNYITVSEYSNDGTVQNYVKRLKNSNTLLKENQIQFFFYSLIQPLKAVHKSSIISLNMLHIKNIYIQDGIVKIGQPIPMNQNLKQILVERADIPDFYHQEWKADPNKNDPKFDTYSLGVLTYKLMYTEYPIFPQGKVHIPTAPTYKKGLKSIVELFLNVGGSLKDLEQNIEVSEDVRLQVKNNEKALQQGSKMFKGVNQNLKIRQNQQAMEIISQLSIKDQQEQAEKKKKGRLYQLYYWFTRRGIDRNRKYESLQKSNFSSYRQCTMATVLVLFYFLTFFLAFMNGLYNLLSHTRLFFTVDVNILGQFQTVIVPNYDQFQKAYQSYGASTLQVLEDKMHCRIDNQNVYYDFVRPSSPHWYIYMILGLLTMITILVLKGMQLVKFSTTTVGYYYYNKTIDGSNLSRFVLSSYIYFQLWFCMALYAFYYLFNYIYQEQHSPCFGGEGWTQLTEILMTDRLEFSTHYLVVILIVFAFSLMSFLQIYSFYERIQYGQLCNPIFVFTPFYFGLLIALRLGAYNKFDPSWSLNKEGIIGSGYMNVIGYFPQILMIVEILICLLIDFLFEKYFDRKIESILMDSSSFHMDKNEDDMKEKKINQKIIE